jgi:hypothetical protein
MCMKREKYPPHLTNKQKKQTTFLYRSLQESKKTNKVNDNLPDD